MNMRIDLSVKNLELLKSFIYKIEREFPDFAFQLRGDGQIEITGDFEADLETKVQALAADFFGQTTRLANRLKSEVRFEVIGLPPSAEYDPKIGINDSNLDGVKYLSGSMSRAISLLDQIFSQFAESLNCEFRHLPSLVTRKDLENMGYLPKDSYQVGVVHCEDHGYAENSSMHACLTPAVCLPLYPSLKSVDMRSREHRFTFCEKAFRRESGKFSTVFPLERIWEFHVRELVFFGNGRLRQDVFDYFEDFLRSTIINLKIHCQFNSATDLFFNPLYSSVAVDQLLNKRKFELNFCYGENRLAIASINFHLNQFTEAYQIQGVGDDFQSFCIAFGLERWLQALLITYGNEEKICQVLEEHLKESRQP